MDYGGEKEPLEEELEDPPEPPDNASKQQLNRKESKTSKGHLEIDRDQSKIGGVKPELLKTRDDNPKECRENVGENLEKPELNLEDSAKESETRKAKSKLVNKKNENLVDEVSSKISRKSSTICEEQVELSEICVEPAEIVGDSLEVYGDELKNILEILVTITELNDKIEVELFLFLHSFTFTRHFVLTYIVSYFIFQIKIRVRLLFNSENWPNNY